MNAVNIHLQNGSLLQGGKYRIVRFISSGGFGCTYEAEHVMLNKRMAIKEFFVKDFCNREETTAHVTVGTLSKKGLVDKLRGKFIDEARGLCHLEHPGIVRVSDVFEENGTAYFVMDYVDGMSLNDIVKEKGRLPQAQALRYIMQVCDALEYVHDHNRLHLDVKPANIMIDKHGHAVLIDFGASKQYDEQEGENTSTLMGKTPGYAPLEQMGNDVVKFMPATDIYALGATLYKALTGVTPPSSNLLATGEDLPPMPPDVSAIVKKAIFAAMEVNKGKRPQSIAKFRALLQGKSGEEDNDVTEINDGGHSKPKPEPEPAPKPAPKPKPSPTPTPAEPDKPDDTGKSKKWIPITAVCVVVLIALGAIFAFISRRNDPGTQVLDKEIVNSNGVKFKFTGVLYSDSIPNGQGIGKYSDGIYTGEYVDGVRHGKATFRTYDGSNVFEGTFENGHYAKGKLTFNDGSYYEGTFINDEFDNGRMTFEDKSYYEGTFKNGEPDKGSWYKADGTLDQ